MVFASTSRINSLIEELEHKLLVMESNTDVSFSEDIKKLHEIRAHVQKTDAKAANLFADRIEKKK